MLLSPQQMIVQPSTKVRIAEHRLLMPSRRERAKDLPATSPSSGGQSALKVRSKFLTPSTGWGMLIPSTGMRDGVGQELRASPPSFGARVRVNSLSVGVPSFHLVQTGLTPLLCMDRGQL